MDEYKCYVKIIKSILKYNIKYDILREREREEVTSKGRDRVTRVWVYHSF